LEATLLEATLLEATCRKSWKVAIKKAAAIMQSIETSALEIKNKILQA
jgi:hypothetical protein